MPDSSSSKKEQLRQVILPVAAEAFLLHGIKAVRMDDIASTLKISKRTLYETYSNKKELFLDSMRVVIEANHKHMLEFAASHDSVMDVLIEFFRSQIESYSHINPVFFEDVQRNPDLMESIRAMHVHSEQNGVMFCQRGVKEGYFRANVNYELLLHLNSDLSQMIRMSGSYQKYEMAEFFYSYVCTVLRGVCTEKGLKRIDDFISRLNH